MIINKKKSYNTRKWYGIWAGLTNTFPWIKMLYLLLLPPVGFYYTHPDNATQHTAHSTHMYTCIHRKVRSGRPSSLIFFSLKKNGLGPSQQSEHVRMNMNDMEREKKSHSFVLLPHTSLLWLWLWLLYLYIYYKKKKPMPWNWNCETAPAPHACRCETTHLHRNLFAFYLVHIKDMKCLLSRKSSFIFPVVHSSGCVLY